MDLIKSTLPTAEDLARAKARIERTTGGTVADIHYDRDKAQIVATMVGHVDAVNATIGYSSPEGT